MGKWNKIKTLSGSQAMWCRKTLISKTERAGCLNSSASYFQHGCWGLNRHLVSSSAMWIIRVDTNGDKMCFVHCVRPFPFSHFSKRLNSLQGKQTEWCGVAFLLSLSKRITTLLHYTWERIQCPRLKWFAQAIQLGKDYQILENPWWQEIAPTFAKLFPPDPES